MTGAAGFIGSHLVRALSHLGEQVIGVDCFLDDSYDAGIKRKNASELEDLPGTTLIEADIRRSMPDMSELGVRTVVNLAAMPGLMKSWQHYDLYESCNVSGLQRLVEQSLANNVEHFIQISTSSVYGRVATGTENDPLNPVSPYGVTKLAAEKLVAAYGTSQGLPFTVLRYFSVYGPGQRPDMAYHILCESILSESEFVVFGDGSQSRSNTHVSDVVAATLLSIAAGPMHQPLNVAGGEVITLLDAIKILENAIGRPARIRFEPARRGDQHHTHGNTHQIERLLNYRAAIGVEDGLVSQAEWHLSQRS